MSRQLKNLTDLKMNFLVKWIIKDHLMTVLGLIFKNWHKIVSVRPYFLENSFLPEHIKFSSDLRDYQLFKCYLSMARR